MTDIATDETDPCDKADSEPSIAVNPRNPQEIVVLTFSEGWGPSVCEKAKKDVKEAPVWRSVDGGKTWEKRFIIPQTRPGQDGPIDQRVVFDSSGRLLIVAMDFGFNEVVYRQANEGSLDLVAGTAFGNDQPLIDVDRTATSKCFNRVYSPWNKVRSSVGVSMVSNSANGGAAMSDVQIGTGDFPNRSTRIAIAPDGTVYAIYKTQEGQVDNRFENARFRVIRSDDCGAKWEGVTSGGVSITGNTTVKTWYTVNDGEGFGNASKGGKTNRARSSDAWIAVDPRNGEVYTAYVKVDSSGFSQIFVARSTDKGITWKSSRIPNDGRHSAFPVIAVAANGTLGVLYIDYDDSGATTVFRHIFARSFDQGETWQQKVLQSMDPVVFSNDEPDFIWGDYEALTAEGDSFYGVFTGESITRNTRQLDPIFFKESASP